MHDNISKHFHTRFGDVFTLDKDKLPRTWTARDNIPEISRASRFAGASVLAQLAVVQYEGPSSMSRDVEQAIRAMAKRDLEDGASESSEGHSETYSIVGIVEWPQVPAAEVLLSPQEVRSVWRRFMSDTKMQITQVDNKVSLLKIPFLVSC